MIALIPNNDKNTYKAFIDSLDDKNGWETLTLKPQENISIIGNLNTRMFNDKAPCLKYFYRNSNIIDMLLLKDTIYKVITYEDDCYIFEGNGWIQFCIDNEIEECIIEEEVV